MDSDQQGLTVGAVAKGGRGQRGDGALLPAPRAAAQTDKPYGRIRRYEGEGRRTGAGS